VNLLDTQEWHKICDKTIWGEWKWVCLFFSLFAIRGKHVPWKSNIITCGGWFDLFFNTRARSLTTVRKPKRLYRKNHFSTLLKPFRLFAFDPFHESLVTPISSTTWACFYRSLSLFLLLDRRGNKWSAYVSVSFPHHTRIRMDSLWIIRFQRKIIPLTEFDQFFFTLLWGGNHMTRYKQSFCPLLSLYDQRTPWKITNCIFCIHSHSQARFVSFRSNSWAILEPYCSTGCKCKIHRITLPHTVPIVSTWWPGLSSFSYTCHIERRARWLWLSGLFPASSMAMI
jgi:hypothetical protein